MTPETPQAKLEELHPASFSWAVACCGGNRDEAEEVLQSVYLQIFEGRARFGGRSSLKTWLFAVIRRHAAGRRRRRALRRLLLARWHEGESRSGSLPGPFRRAEESERSTRVRRALAGLSPRQRQAIELVFFQEHSVREASVAMGVSLGSARTHYARAKRALAESLGGGRIS